MPLDLDGPTTARLAKAYDELRRACAGPRRAPSMAAQVAAAHGAVLEVATLLGGRTPESADEIAYVEARTAAIERLAAALARAARAPQSSSMSSAGPDPALLIEARQELDSLTGTNALTRLDDLTTDAERGRARPGAPPAPGRHHRATGDR